MKIRTGFVSNSSSSSFTVLLPMELKDVNSLSDIIMSNVEANPYIPKETIKKWVDKLAEGGIVNIYEEDPDEENYELSADIHQALLTALKELGGHLTFDETGSEAYIINMVGFGEPIKQGE